jgi:hypothetical protein
MQFMLSIFENEANYADATMWTDIIAAHTRCKKLALCAAARA